MRPFPRWPRGAWPPIAIAVVAAALRFWRLADAALIGDESYYWLWSQRLAPSYFDNPAGVALVVRLSTLLAGQGEAGVRWLNALLGVGAVLLAYAIGARLFPGYAAPFSSALLALGAPYLVISRFVYTDALQLFLLLLNVYLLIPFLPAGEGGSQASIAPWRFWAAGFSTAALLNTKYNAYLYALAAAAVLAWARPGLLRDRRAWGAVGLALCGLLPTLAWNAAHQWASFRWQFQHFVAGAAQASTPLGSLRHAVAYLTPPLALSALVGATRVRGARRRLLLIPALVLTVPVLLSPADSPRNLVAGAALLLLLCGDAVQHGLSRCRRAVAASALGLLVLSTGAYGVGTVLETLDPTWLPHSPVATAIRQEGVGWRSAPALGLDAQVPVFALDYSMAAQLRYYARIPAQTSWGQYRLWGIPQLDDAGAGGGQEVLIVALCYVDPALVSERLGLAFEQVQGPQERVLGEGGETKVLLTWRARGRRVDAETFLDLFDFVDLLRAGQRAARQGDG